MLGDTVRSTRIRRGLTQAKLARLAGVSRRHLAALEKGANVSVNVLRKIASVLDLAEIDLGGISVKTTRATAENGVNVPLLADTLREARVDATRAQTLLARAEALVGWDGVGLVEFPKTDIRLIDVSGDGLNDQEEVMKVPLAGEIRNGEPIDESMEGELVVVPNSVIEGEEVVLRVRGDALQPLNIADGDLLIIENRPRGRAANGEMVVAKIGKLAYVGRWWQKHGHRAVNTNPATEGTTDKNLKVMAAVTVILRNNR